ncbi:hypothetical protein FQA39_LY13939 [Lamprigera yunnana]|nr:hypothetical protein FQA39_LY13939 [Lamprigera yunnana]
MWLYATYLCFFFKIAYASECVPPSCQINALEAEPYTFGFSKNSSVNITRCSYTSDSGLSGTFVVDSSLKKGSKSPNGNEVTDLGASGLCQLTLKKADENGPKLWTLQSFHKGTLHKEINFTVNYFYKAPLLSESVSVVELENFYQYFNVSTKFTGCKVRLGETEVDLRTKQDLEGVDGRMKSLGNDICGFIFSNVSKMDPINWCLIAEDALGKSYRANFKVIVYDVPPVNVRNTKLNVQLGLRTTVVCGNKYQQDFCYLYNPKGKFVQSGDDCSYPIKTVTMDHLGVWKCKIGKFPSMQTLEYNIELVFTGNENVKTWISETKNHIKIGCKLNNGGRISACRIISPKGDVWNLRPGVAYARYLSIGTNFKNATCILWVRKPVLETEKGQWRCEMHSGGSRTGGFIFIENTTIPNYETYKNITTQIGEELKIECNVPYSSEYCYIQSPDGTKYVMKDNYESRLGSCFTTIPKARREDVGLWTCFFARDMSVADEKLNVEVTLAEVLLYTTNAEASSGGNVSLLCSSYGVPLKYCRFIAPNALSYFIHNHQKSSRISYKGKGLEYGECGITIRNAQPSDSGVWTCITRLGGDYSQEEISTKINLYVTPTFFKNPTVGIAFGTGACIIILSALGYFGVNKFKKMRRPTLDASNSISSDNNTEEDVLNYGNTSYSTLEHHAHQT